MIRIHVSKSQRQSDCFGLGAGCLSWDFNVAFSNRLFPAPVMKEQGASVIVSTLGKKKKKDYKLLKNHPSQAHGLCAAGTAIVIAVN